METLAWLHYASACDESSPAVGLRGFGDRPGKTFPVWRSIWLCCAGLVAVLSVLGGETSAIYAALRCGDRGAQVAELQRRLSIPVDGIFGHQTQQAVRNFQHQHGLQVDGIVGPQTSTALGITPVSQPTSYTENLYFIDLPPQYTGLNVRQGAGASFPILNSLPNGTVVSVVEEQRDRNGQLWAKLSAGGWVTTEFLSPTATNTVADLKGFYPKIQDFGLENYSSGKYPVATKNALSVYDLIDFFGSDNICYNRSDDYSQVPCIPKAIAQTWLNQQSKLLQQDGHSEGLGVASLLFTENTPEMQNTLQQSQHWLTSHQIDHQDAKRLSAAALTPAWSHLIARYTTLQRVDEITNQNREIRQKSPSEILAILKNGLQNQRGFTLGLYQLERDHLGNLFLTAGYVLTPFAVEDLGQGKMLVRVYDSNFPHTVQTVEFDLNKNTWRYKTPMNEVYSGDRSSQNLELTSLSSRTNPLLFKAQNPPFSCPFCQTNSALGISLIGQGKLTVTGDRNQAIQEAVTKPYKGGQGKRTPPTYQVPYRQNTPYHITISDIQVPWTNQITTGTGAPEGGNVVITGPGFIAAAEGIQPSSGKVSRMTIQGQEDQVKLSFTTNQFSTKSPKLVFAVDQQVDRQNRIGGYIFEVETMDLSQDALFTAGLDTKNKVLYFEDNDMATKQKRYNIKVTHFLGDTNSPIEIFSLTNAVLTQAAGQCRLENNQQVNCPRIYLKYGEINASTGEVPIAVTSQSQPPQQYTSVKGQVTQLPTTTLAKR